MALGSTPSLTEINTELGTTGQSLNTCIANAGKTGVWDRQSDFAGYSVGTISVVPSFSSVGTSVIRVVVTVTSSSSWAVVTPLDAEVSSVVPSTGNGSLNSVSINLNTYSGSLESIIVVFKLAATPIVTANAGIDRG